MPNVKIKQLENAVATTGLSMGGGAKRRKLQPGEVVFIPEDLLADNGKQNLFDLLYATGKLEITPEQPTRPLDYADENEARLTSPTFRITGDDSAQEVARAKETVAQRMEQPRSAVRADKAPPESPAAETPTRDGVSEPEAHSPEPATSGRRGTRRTSRRGTATHGAANSA